MIYRVEVLADDSGCWVGNGMRFDTVDEAEQYARGLQYHWSAVREWKVTPVKEEQ